MSAGDLSSLLVANRTLLEEATALEAGSEGSWRKHAVRKKDANRPDRRQAAAAQARGGADDDRMAWQGLLLRALV